MTTPIPTTLAVCKVCGAWIYKSRLAAAHHLRKHHGDEISESVYTTYTSEEINAAK